MNSLLGVLSFSVTELLLLAMLLVVGVLALVAYRRIRRLEARLEQSQRQIMQEIKMVNQGAIGIGRRFAAIEKGLKKPQKVADFSAIRAEALAKQTAQPETPKHAKESDHVSIVEKPASPKKTKAEQALFAWLNDHQTA